MRSRSANTIRTAEPVTVYAADIVGPIAGGGNCSPANVLEMKLGAREPK